MSPPKGSMYGVQPLRDAQRLVPVVLLRGRETPVYRGCWHATGEWEKKKIENLERRQAFQI